MKRKRKGGSRGKKEKGGSRGKSVKGGSRGKRAKENGGSRGKRAKGLMAHDEMEHPNAHDVNHTWYSASH